MSDIPWWGLPLIAAAFTLLGVAAAQLVTIRNEHGRKQAEKTVRWYEERKSAYVGLLAAYERTMVRLRAGFAAGVTEPDPLLYSDEVGSALTQVRLLASAPVRSAALAVHILFEDMHSERAAWLPGREPEQRFLERLAHVPLVMHDLEVAVRDELGIDPTPFTGPPPAAPAAPDWRQRVRTLVARSRRPAAGTAPTAVSADRPEVVESVG